MKTFKYILGICLSALSFGAFAQGLDGIVVEKYYLSDAADAANASAEGAVTPLTVGTTVYRVYVDMASGYKFSQLYGSPTHNLVVNATADFYNDPNYGVAVNPGTITATNIVKHTAMIDSWFTTGGTSNGTAGVLKSEDTNGSLGNNQSILANNPGGCYGLPINGSGAQDGMVPSDASTYVVPNTLGLGTALDVLDQTAGNAILIDNGTIAALGGVVGATSSNMVLVAQFAVAGDISFQFNVQIINIATNEPENYVASNPVSGELTHPSLTYSSVNIAPVVSVTSPANGANVLVGANVNISASASDANGTITQVEFFVDGVSVGVDTSAPYSASYSAVLGAHTITAVATDSDCESTTSTSVNINVNNPAPTGVANDDFANATSVNSADYPFCSNRTVNLTNATASPEAQTSAPVGAGQDAWYQFVAESQAARVTSSSTVCDVVIELQDALGNLLFSENETTSGQEILIANNLTVGDTYYVLVRNFNTSAVGNVTTCIQSLATSQPNNGTTFNNLCSFIKCRWNGANLYSVTFDDGTNQYSASSTQTQINFSALGGIQYGTTYQVTFSSTFILNDAAGNPTTSVVTSAPFTVTIGNHAPVALRSADRCPTTRNIGAFIGTDVTVCGAIGYEWEFTLADEFGTPISIDPLVVAVNQNSRYIRTTSINGVLPGDHYNVRVRPLFSYGAGTYGSTQMLCIAGSASAPVVNNDFEVSSLNADALEINVYPNPNNGDFLNVRISNVSSESIQVKVLDAMGRLVYANQYSANGTLNGSIVFDRMLASGLYSVEVIDGENIQTQKVLVVNQ